MTDTKKRGGSDSLHELVVQTPVKWAEEEGITILDPDGWRGRDSKSFDEPITKVEFTKRMQFSTIMHNKLNEPRGNQA